MPNCPYSDTLVQRLQLDQSCRRSPQPYLPHMRSTEPATDTPLARMALHCGMLGKAQHALAAILLGVPVNDLPSAHLKDHSRAKEPARTATIAAGVWGLDPSITTNAK